MASFRTGHGVFDYISALQEGASILVLDETGFESLIFLNALFSNYGDKSKIILVSDELVETPFNLQRISLEKIPNLTALSIEVEGYRENVKGGGVIIHNYLPHILVREEEERVLKLVESWRERVTDERMVEVYTLPKGSFPSFEGKARTLLSGVVTIKLVEGERGRHLSFQVSGVCKAAYHMAVFPFMVKEGRLLVKWGEDFTERVFEEELDQVLRRQGYIKEKIYSLRVVKGGSEPEGLDMYERWLLSQCVGRDVVDLYHYFPDRFEEVSRFLASWSLRGIVRLEEREGAAPEAKRRDLSVKTRLALRLPTSLAMSSLTSHPHLIPLDVYHALRRSVISFITLYTPLSEEEFVEKLSVLEGHFQEMAARVTAVNKLVEGGEAPEVKMDLRHLPKLLSITLFFGYHLRPRVVKASPREYEVRVRDCFLCEGVVSERPVCQLIEGTLIGAAGVLFKEKFSCQEVKCKAMGDDCCAFSLKAVPGGGAALP